jgi:translation initiation factor 5A
MEEENEFQHTDAGATGMEKTYAGSLHKGDLVMIKGHPCRVVSFSTAKTGKHGSAKAMISGIDVFTSNKYECTFSTSDNVDAPVIKRLEYNLINIEDDGFVTLLNEQGETKEDLKLPEDEWLKDVAEKTKEIFEDGSKECIVTVISALGMEKIIAVREGKD